MRFPCKGSMGKNGSIVVVEAPLFEPWMCPQNESLVNDFES